MPLLYCTEFVKNFTKVSVTANRLTQLTFHLFSFGLLLCHEIPFRLHSEVHKILTVEICTNTLILTH